MHALLLLITVSVQLPASQPPKGDVARWEREARNVTIVRDDWGIAHVHGKTDADAVFGMIYAQAEDDFNRVETNYLNSIGPAGRGGGRGRDLAGPADEAVHRSGQHAGEVRREPGVAQATDERLGRRAQLLPPHPSGGEAAGHHPLRAVDGAHLQRGQHRRRHRERRRSTSSGRSTATAPAGPRRPWAAERRRSERADRARTASRSRRRTPSNHRALLLINPHTSFFFRSELQMTSDEGLNAYGAATWGQFFLYQGFNDRLGWMHTSTGADAIDEYAETVVRKGGRLFYRYGARGAADRDASGSPSPIGPRAGWRRGQFTVYRTHHGPVVRAAERQVDQRPADGEADRGAEPVVPADQGADARDVPEGDGAPRQLVEQHGLRRRRRAHRLLPPAVRAPSGTTGSTGPGRWTAAIPRPSGTACTASRTARTWSIRRTAGSRTPTTGRTRRRARTARSGRTSPGTWTQAGESPRGLHAIRVLEGRKDFTLDRLRDAAFDSYLTAFARLAAAAAGGVRLDAATATRSRRGSPSRSRRSARGTTGGRRARCRRRSRCTGARRSWSAHGRAAARGRHGGVRLHGDARDGGAAARRARRGGRPARRATSAPGGRRGARSTGSSGSPATSCSRSTTRGRASRCRSPRRGGARSRRSARAPIPGTKRMYGT